MIQPQIARFERRELSKSKNKKKIAFFSLKNVPRVDNIMHEICITWEVCSGPIQAGNCKD
jgi:hypothetical protein